MSIWDDIGSVFTAPVDAITGVTDFLRLAGWIFNPINWLRMVEFVIGSIMVYVGLRMATRRQTQGIGSQVKQFVKEIPGATLASKIVK